MASTSTPRSTLLQRLYLDLDLDIDIDIDIDILHLGLLCFNDPLFGITFVFHQWYITFIAEFLQAGFWAIILLFWLTVLDSLATEQGSARRFEAFHLPKLVFAFIFWLLFSFSHGWVAWHHMASPYYSEDEEGATETMRDDAGVGIYGMVEYSLLITMLIYALWLGQLSVKSLYNWGKLDQRLRLLCLFTAAMICMTMTAFFTFWKLHEGETGEETAPLKFVTFTTLFNLYVGLLTVLCTPSEGNQKIK